MGLADTLVVVLCDWQGDDGRQHHQLQQQRGCVLVWYHPE